MPVRRLVLTRYAPLSLLIPWADRYGQGVYLTTEACKAKCHRLIVCFMLRVFDRIGLFCVVDGGEAT